MSTQFITTSYNDAIQINFTQDAWFNATQVAASFGKRVNDWLNLDSTQDYIKRLHHMMFPDIQLPENMVIKKNQLLEIKGGAPSTGGGSWLHPKLSIKFARWLDVDFEIWCDLQIEKILHPTQYGLKQLPPQKSKKAITGGLTLETQDDIKKLIQDRAALLPKDKQADFVIKMWSALSTHFGIKKEKGDKTPAYKYISESYRLECLSLMARLSVDDLVTLTHDEFEAKVAERIALLPKPDVKQGELLPPSHPQGMMINLTPLDDNKSRRWLAVQSRDCVLSVYSLDDELVLSEADFITQLERKGFVVVKQEALKKALHRACNDTILAKAGEILNLNNTEVYKASEKAFFETLK